ncbi:YceD family protein [Govanella unica]|uniref:DUF177 domain-containing protein n=1 Tax=Govanella unica TaxID=2975056 RepID=A0A9X3TYF9_9PROT|nr:DUF177 domain-containing protein [Govania unica]MDA5194096.1 DUF177 domain-containing protein [Govania unica]
MSTEHKPAQGPYEFSRTVAVYDVRDGGLRLGIVADPRECVAMARRFEVLGLANVKAELRLMPLEGGDILLEGRAEAQAEQACIVTGEPVKSTIASEFSVRYISPGIGTESFEDEDFDVLGEDTEPLPADVIDVGEVVTQYLSLAIDPYPRKPGAVSGVVELTPEGVVPSTERANPFDALKKLQEKG